MGIVSITPRVDYCQGNDWDMFQLKTMDDLHKPALDGIGYQDLLTYEMARWGGNKAQKSIGKQLSKIFFFYFAFVLFFIIGYR